MRKRPQQQRSRELVKALIDATAKGIPVSYTHLTLPTICSV